MRLQDSRRETRTDRGGDLVLLEDQERGAWDQRAIEEGAALVRHALHMGPPGPYALQAAIAAVHAEAPIAEATDWVQLVGLYDLLLQAVLSPVVALNRAVAVAFAHGFEVGLAAMDGLASDPSRYHLFHAARADLLRRLDRTSDARAAYDEALGLCQNEAERRFLSGRLDGLR